MTTTKHQEVMKKMKGRRRGEPAERTRRPLLPQRKRKRTAATGPPGGQGRGWAGAPASVPGGAGLRGEAGPRVAAARLTVVPCLLRRHASPPRH